jgi:UDP-N-acetyl-D-mannosaminuronic acid dehydrogenase
VKHDVCVIGGFGHVGLPLSIAFASKGLAVAALDLSEEKLVGISAGRLPFIEHGAEEILGKVLESGRLSLSLSPEVIRESEFVVIVVGTPVDQHLNPRLDVLKDLLNEYLEYLSDNQCLVLRSTVYPGTTQRVCDYLQEKGKFLDVAFCPERIAEGYAMTELFDLPQIVSSFSERGVRRASDLFRNITPDIVVLDPLEAELSKLFTNTWRYIKFSVANQFLMIANDAGVDYSRIHHAITHKYPRAKDIPTPGFAAGPCLFKDAVQLSAFNNHTFFLGHSALLVNEGLPYYIINKLKAGGTLREKAVGVLGMAFKANVDDKRESLSYKLKKLLEFECRRVYCSDPYIQDPGFVSTEELVEQSDIVILATPHDRYRDLRIGDGKRVVDVWNFFGGGCRV